MSKFYLIFGISLSLCSCASPWPRELDGTTLEPINTPAMVANIIEEKK